MAFGCRRSAGWGWVSTIVMVLTGLGIRTGAFPLVKRSKTARARWVAPQRLAEVWTTWPRSCRRWRDFLFGCPGPCPGHRRERARRPGSPRGTPGTRTGTGSRATRGREARGSEARVKPTSLTRPCPRSCRQQIESAAHSRRILSAHAAGETSPEKSTFRVQRIGEKHSWRSEPTCDGGRIDGSTRRVGVVRLAVWRTRSPLRGELRACGRRWPVVGARPPGDRPVALRRRRVAPPPQRGPAEVIWPRCSGPGTRYAVSDAAGCRRGHAAYTEATAGFSADQPTSPRHVLSRY